MKEKGDIFTKAMSWKDMQALAQQADKDDNIEAVSQTSQSTTVNQSATIDRPANLDQPDFTKAMSLKEIQALALQVGAEELSVSIEPELSGALPDLEN